MDPDFLLRFCTFQTDHTFRKTGTAMVVPVVAGATPLQPTMKPVEDNRSRDLQTCSLLPGGLLIRGHLTGNSIPSCWFQQSSRTGGRLFRVAALPGFAVTSYHKIPY